VKGCHNPIPSLTHEDSLVTDDATKASIFNQYFHSMFTTEGYSDLPSLHNSLQFKPDLIDSIIFSAEDVFNELTSLKADKACGPDCILAQLLKKGAELISSPLAKLFQSSLSSSKLPQDWMTANAVPVYKKGDTHLASNYQPISLTWFLNKHSTITLLLQAVNDWAISLEERHSVHCRPI